MEIKIDCVCGTRFKFDVEPVNGRMPVPVNCPACGMSATSQANEIIRQTLEATAAPPPVPAAAMAAAPPSRPAASPGLRPPAGAAPPPSRPPPPLAASVLFSPEKAKPGNKWKIALSTVVVLACCAFGLWKFGSKWYGHIRSVVEVATEIAKSDSAGGLIADDFLYDSVVLFIRHTNHAAVAEASQAWWKQTLTKDVVLSPAAEGDGVLEGEPLGENVYVLLPARQGWVWLIGGTKWPQPQHDALAQHLSQQLGTLVLEVRDVEVPGIDHFGVYDRGARKFHARIETKPGRDEDFYDSVAAVEGESWALASGYTPGSEGFKAFRLDDAIEIAQRLGLNLEDEEEGELEQIYVLKEKPL